MLSEEEGLVLRAVEAFNDTQEVKREQNTESLHVLVYFPKIFRNLHDRLNHGCFMQTFVVCFHC